MRKRALLIVAAVSIAVMALGISSAFAGTSGGHSNATAALKATTAHNYTTASTGGTGQVFFTIPTLPNGNYLVSYTANFYPVAGESFTCALIGNSALYSQDTVFTPASSGFYGGVNGVAAIHNPSADGVFVDCGTADGSAWSFGTRTLVVTLTRLDGLTNGVLNPAPKQKGHSSLTTR